MQLLVIGAAVGQAVNQPGIAVEGKNNGSFRKSCC